MQNKVWAFRTAVVTDLPFLYDAWLSSFRDSKWAGVIPNNEYRATYTKTINDLLRRGMVVTMATADDDPNQFLGFIAHEVRPSGEYAVHYCYVKDGFRGHGLAKDLARHIGLPDHFCYTFRTRTLPPGKGRWVPEIARRLKL